MKVGRRIRQLRKDKNMTLEELSEKSGVALATLSRMENNKMTGTLDSHYRISKALSCSLSEFYRNIEDESKVVEPIARTKRTEHFPHSSKARCELLVTKPLEKKIMPLMIKLAPGGETQEEKSDPGLEKFLYLISGSMEATVGGVNYLLKKGDSLYFDASLSHSFNNTSKADTEAICVLSSPTA
ncbi:MAG: cupin domain-containing protein [Candidatus Tantalella remota]|nr:cupin domain-containing protein [Candidatus Tantalella remota]